MPDEKQIRVVEILNPFRPADERKTTALTIRPHESPRDAMVRAGIDPEKYDVERKGEILPPECSLAVTDGDELLLHPRLESGFWGMLGMMALMIGLAVFTGGVGAGMLGLFASGMFMGMSATTAMIVGGAIALGGAALVSWSIVSAPSASPMLPSATYDPTGSKMLAQAGTPVPKAYGTFTWSGNAISNYADFEGKDQYINLLVCFGFGPAKSVSNITINGRSVEQYRDTGYFVRLGTNTQGPIATFNKTVNTYPVGSELLVEGPVVVPGTGTNVQGLQIGIKFPGGLIRYDDSGNPKEVSFAYKVEVAPHGTQNWTQPIFPRTTTDVVTTDGNGYQHYPYWVVVPTDRFKGSDIVYSTDTDQGAHYIGESWTNTMTVTAYDVNNNSFQMQVTLTGEWQPCDPGLSQQNVTDWWRGWRIVSQMNPSSFFDVVNVYGLAPGQWDTRVTFWGAGPHNQPIPYGDVTDSHYQATGWVWYVNELAFNDFAYPNMILVGIRALASTQFTASNVQVQATITHDIGADTVIPAALAGFEHDNPAIVAYDLITNPLYGMRYSPNFVDVASFVRWAQRCDELVTNSDNSQVRRFVFNGVFDQSQTGWQALQQIGNMSQCVVGMPGGKFTAILDCPDIPVQLFNINNIIKDSFRETWVSLDDRCNLIEVTFADAARNYKTDLPVQVMTADDLQSGVPPKTTRVNLLGCTSRDQAWRWAYQHLLSTKLCLRTVSFKTKLAGLGCRIGSLIAVQHDVPQWAYGGLIIAGSTTTQVVLDRVDLPTFTANQGWTLSVQHPTLLRGTATIQSVTAGAVNTITLTAAPPSGRILRLQSSDGAFETSIRGVTGNVLTVDALGSLGAGATVNLYDQDAIELALVSAVTVSDTITTVTVTTPFSQAPATDAAYAYGQSNDTQPAKLFRVTNLRRSGDFDVQVTGLEYQSLVYEDQIPAYGQIVGAPVVTAPVSNLTLTEVYQNGAVAGNALASQLAIGWTNGPGTAGAQVQFTVNGGDRQFLTRVTGSHAVLNITEACAITVYVTGFDYLGNLDFTNAAEASITIQAQSSGSQIPAPTNLVIEDDASTQTVNQDGTVIPRMYVSWTAPNDQAVLNGGSYWINYSFGTGTKYPQGQLPPVPENMPVTWDPVTSQYISPWISAAPVSGSATSCYIDGIGSTEFANITVKICSVRPDGTISAWVTASNHTPTLNQVHLPIVRTGGSGVVFTFSDNTSLADVQPAQAGADVTAQNAVTLLQNPNFAAGAAGWNPYTGWSVVSWGATGVSAITNSPNVGHFYATTATTSSMVNQQEFPLRPGDVVGAACWVLAGGTPTGGLYLRINYYDQTGTYITSSVSPSAQIIGVWQQLRIVGTAPANTAWATIDVATGNATGTWLVCGFAAALQANSLDEVPDGATYGKVAGVSGNLATTASLQASAINATVTQQTTQAVAITSAPTQIATASLVTSGGYVKVRVYGMITSSNALGWSISLYKGDNTGTLLAQEAYGSFPAYGQYCTVALEGLDTNPGSGSVTYTAYANVGQNGTGNVLPVIFIVENAKR